MDLKKLAAALIPDTGLLPPEEYEKIYPERDRAPKAEVTRLAPSPTGFIHLGNLYSALADERSAHTTGGIFYLRIEDTDEKRRVDGAVESVIRSLNYFGINFDEGAELPQLCKEAFGAGACLSVLLHRGRAQRSA